MSTPLRADRFRLSLDDDVLTGAVDPSAGVGVIAAIGSLYLQTIPAQLWQKVGAGDTEWLLVLTGTVHGFRGFFGTGLDGDAVISGGVTSLTRDMFYQNLTVQNTGTLQPSGYRVYVAGTLTVDPGGAIHRNGNAAVGATAGGVVAAVFLGGGAAGGNGSTTTGANGSGSSNGIAGLPAGRFLGGAGGAGASGAGGGGGSYAAATADAGAPYNFTQLLLGYQPSATTWPTLYQGGAGGGGGGGAAGVAGGGGGGGAGIMVIAARTVINNGTISVNGGAGAAGGGANRGGGGGGGGGLVAVVYETFSGAQPTATGGTAGASGGGTGVAGNPGGQGFVYTATP